MAQAKADVKTPYFISLASGDPFAFAGVVGELDDKETGESLQTTTLITTDANEFMKPNCTTACRWCSSRPGGSNGWRDDDSSSTTSTRSRRRCNAWPVDRRVNNARNEGRGSMRWRTLSDSRLSRRRSGFLRTADDQAFGPP